MKLSHYSAIASTILIPAKMHSQVSYTNFDPDIDVWSDGTECIFCASNCYTLDLDDNGSGDFKFESLLCYTTGTVYQGASIQILDTGMFAFAATGMSDPKVLNYGDVISPANNWVNELHGLLARVNVDTYNSDAILSSGGNFYLKYGKFIGFRKEEAGDYYYGWIRLSLEAGNPPFLSTDIHDMALNATPNDPLFAGETGLSCNTPFQLLPVSLSPTATTIKWQPMAGAYQYKIKYRKEGVAAWTTLTVNAPKSSKKLTGLNCYQDYEWKIAASCDGGATFSAFSDIQTFRTALCRIGDDEIMPDIQVYPNPASELIYIDLDGIEENTVIELSDMQGRIIETRSAHEHEFLQIDLSPYATGIYLLSIKGQTTQVSKKIIKH